MSDRADAFAAALATVQQLEDSNHSQAAQLEVQRTDIAVLTNENESLRKEISKANRKADLFYRAYVALRAKLPTISAVVNDAIKESELHLYSGQTTEKRESPIGDAPKFLKGSPIRVLPG